MTKMVIGSLAALILAYSMSGNVHAASLVQNGNFETITGASGGQLGDESQATHWTTSGYNFIFTSASQATSGVTGSDGNLALWGPGNGSANGLTDGPVGSAFVGADGAYEVGAINQTISGLTSGYTYAVSFFWGAAQQEGFSGATTDIWTVSLGGTQAQSTGIDSIASHGFEGWQQQTFDYTANSSSEVLSFLAKGTPNGEPPFALLDGVSMTVTPEPSSLVAMFVGVLGLCAIIRRRVRGQKTAS